MTSSVFENLPPCSCELTALEHDDVCPAGLEVERRTAGMTPAERLALVKGEPPQ